MLGPLLAIACLSLAGAADERVSEARLLVQKRILNRYLVEGRDIIVDYNIYNVGGSVALDVRIVDSSFGGDFQVVSGLLDLKVDRLPPNANLSHTVVVRSSKPGRFNFTGAEVYYRTSEEGREVQVGHTSEPGEGGIVPGRDFDRQFSPHVMDWLAFAVMSLPVPRDSLPPVARQRVQVRRHSEAVQETLTGPLYQRQISYRQ
uniref:Translocon-associated protein subunit beta n=1 Tax=Argas monolakensis TaxID=34602 RepID=Q09JT6_ARGMO|nr:translocon associated complex TRAP beta-subunit [Argas monolakensis]